MICVSSSLLLISFISKFIRIVDLPILMGVSTSSLISLSNNWLSFFVLSILNRDQSLITNVLDLTNLAGLISVGELPDLPPS